MWEQEPEGGQPLAEAVAVAMGGGSQLLIPASKRTKKKDFIPEAVPRAATSPNGAVSPPRIPGFGTNPSLPSLLPSPWSAPGGDFPGCGALLDSAL